MDLEGLGEALQRFLRIWYAIAWAKSNSLLTGHVKNSNGSGIVEFHIIAKARFNPDCAYAGRAPEISARETNGR